MVDGLVVVDKACFHHDFAAGGVLHGVGAGKPITVCILEPVFYQSVQSLVVQPLPHQALPMQ